MATEPLVIDSSETKEETGPSDPSQTTPTTSTDTPTTAAGVKPTGPASLAEEKAYATMKEAESKVTSGTSFFGKVFG